MILQREKFDYVSNNQTKEKNVLINGMRFIENDKRSIIKKVKQRDAHLKEN